MWGRKCCEMFTNVGDMPRGTERGALSAGHSFMRDQCTTILFRKWHYFTSHKRRLRRLCFYRCLSVHTGGHAWLLPGGCAWLLRGGACVVFLGGMHFFGGVCVVFSDGACIGYDEIRSMSRRYASYWNACLLKCAFWSFKYQLVQRISIICVHILKKAFRDMTMKNENNCPLWTWTKDRLLIRGSSALQ